MKVIEKGIDDNKKVKCDYCSSKLEYDKKDVHYNEHLKVKFIICPVCNNMIYIN